MAIGGSQVIRPVDGGRKRRRRRMVIVIVAVVVVLVTAPRRVVVPAVLDDPKDPVTAQAEAFLGGLVGR